MQHNPSNPSNPPNPAAKPSLQFSQAPSLKWSRSQQVTYETCHRARYFAAELAPTGGSRKASAIARTAYRLKTLTALPMEAGRVLHERAAEIATAIRAGEDLPPLVQLRQRNRARMNHVWVSSRDRVDEWHRDPKHVPMLRERYYGRSPSPEQVARIRERLESGVVTLRQLGLWGEVGACRPQDILMIDKLDSYVLADILEPVVVWAAADLVIRTDPNGPWEVIDFKTGRAPGGRALQRDMDQVISYAVWLRHGAHVLGDGEGCQGRLIYLGDGTEIPFAISAAEIDAAEKRIRDGALAMHRAREVAERAAADAITHAVMEGLPPEEVSVIAERARRQSGAYDMTADRTKCFNCPYLELCQPEQHALEGSALHSLPEAA